MKMVCVKPINSKLTLGKIYDVEDSAIRDKINTNKDYFLVTDDSGFRLGYYAHRFVSLKEYRKQKINKIYESVC